MKTIQVAVIVGSLRKDSFNRKLANAIVKLAPASVHFQFVEIGDLPLYNQDDDEHQAASVLRMKAEIEKSEGVLFVTPEYNRSIPGVLKNALDHGSRPFGKNSWGKKPAAIIGISPSPVGTALAQQHLRGVLATLDMLTLGQPEMFLQIKDGFFDDSGNIGEASKKFILRWIDTMIQWIELNSK
ncbi:NADPH-dependent FMN reductase [Polynucleobacter sp. UK-Gri1-W3]|uniref:NADPH-dependent FMN reductase n=1 Tax=Polynucleobacter sp. UK-Gri1-W3 TaxID=1819737 RepID=UPI001C0D859E|nr:NADPH-dependent FMN reductase [Polynucleobacter sp. UK-Gri1-W3]MBU3538675.1 NAD(P)H-dependent oxidoreductase [Polynucleobacter sp. UK-Gri1-W3]